LNITPHRGQRAGYAAIVRNMALLRAIADAGSSIASMAMEGEGARM
jgi:replicative DNA helicase